jgi:hypothetical protein
MHRFQRWRDALQLAPDVKAVSGVMQEYVATLTPEDLEHIPAPCRAALFETPLDVPGIAVCLLQAELSWKGRQEDWALLHDVAHIFALAATRLTLVQREPVLVR